ncbi:flavin reductase family protein [Oscillospiraceae bacterium PP1C4]
MNKLSPYELTQNPFELINKKWAMITTRAGDKTNTMTASWGGVGILWNKPVVYVFLRPQRYTRELIDQSERFSVCFLPEQYRDRLKHCGVASGRDEDKLATCGFEMITLDDAPVLAQSEISFTCRKLFCQRLDPASILDSSIDTVNYPHKDYHFMYVAEILGVYEK